MDTSQEGFLLIATFTVLLVCFVLVVLAVMLIYRRRKIQHVKEVKEMNQRFQRELLQSQLEIQAQTMEQIGQELHDHVGSQLTLASLYTNQLPAGENGEPSVGEEIGKIIDDALVDLRSLSKNLTQGQAAQRTSLRELLRQECVKVNRIAHCEVRFESNAPDLPGSLEVNSFVLRIVQEFIQNSLKHAQCQTIWVSLTHQAEGHLLTLKDDGVGFDLQPSDENAGIGLQNMKSRAEIIQGIYTFTSAPGQGTEATLLIPTQPSIVTS